MDKRIIVHTDGGSRGNPGPGAAAFVLSDADGGMIGGRGVFLGETTNNVAEYTGLLESLKAARKLGAQSVEVFSDSELMVRQINGEYKVKSPKLRPLFEQSIELLGGFSTWRVNHVLREKNTKADDLANRAMDLKRDVRVGASKKATTGKRIRIGALISGGGRTVLNIKKEIEAGNLNAEIAIVISSRSAVKGVQRAKDAGLSVEIVRKKDSADVEQFSNRVAEVLNEAKVDLVVQAGWLCLWRIPPEYQNRVMNIHPALLPSFGGQGMWGRHVHEAVLKAGCKVSGCTVHFCTNEYDKGAIIVQRCCEVADNDDADSLAARVFEQECIAYPEAIRLFAEERLSVENGIVKVRQLY